MLLFDLPALFGAVHAGYDRDQNNCSDTDISSIVEMLNMGELAGNFNQRGGSIVSNESGEKSTKRARIDENNKKKKKAKKSIRSGTFF